MLILGIVLLCSFSVFADINHYYKIDLLYNQGNLSYQNLAVQPSPQQLQNPEGRYIAEVVSYDNKILNLTFFVIPLTVFYDRADPETGELNDGGVITLQRLQTDLYVPYYANAKEINIYDQELIKKLSIDVSSYAQATKEQKASPAFPEAETAPSAAKEETPELPIIEPKIKPKTKILLGVLIGIVMILTLVALLLILKRRIK